MSRLIKRYHDNWVDDRQDTVRQDYLSGRVYETIKNLVTVIMKREFAGKLLDIGCGDGSFVRMCNKRGLDAAGIDIKDKCDFEADRLPYRDDAFDIVFMYSVIEHIADPDNILNEIRRVLKKDGLVIIITPEWRYSARSFYDDATHVRPYTSRSLRSLMGMYGFKKPFTGLWTVKKSPFVWRLPESIQFLYGRLLPFNGLQRYVPAFLKGRSDTLLACFSNAK